MQTTHLQYNCTTTHCKAGGLTFEEIWQAHFGRFDTGIERKNNKKKEQVRKEEEQREKKK